MNPPKNAPSPMFYVGLLCAAVGAGMVLSASSVEAYAEGGSAYSLFVQQTMPSIRCVWCR